MQKNLSEGSVPKGWGSALKFALMGFVALSVGAAVYKIAAFPDNAPGVIAATAAPEKVPAAAKSEPITPRSTAKKPAKAAAEVKTAVVYYFYTNTRCSSCKAIEAYTREVVEKNFISDYKGWTVVFRAINIEEEPYKHFVQDYWLNTKSVVVQKFSGNKPLKYAKLEKVWRLLGDKAAFADYITAETHKLLDEK